jgi:nitrogen fixation/metabolism regulation signal transduction histidine kinase
VARTRSQLALVAAAFYSWPAECVILSPDGTIMVANGAWRRFGEANGAGARCGPGTNYLQVTHAAVASGDETAEVALASLEAVLSGCAPRAQLNYPCHSPDEQRWFRLHAAMLPGRHEVLVVHEDISGLVLGKGKQAVSDVCRRPGIRPAAGRRQPG